MVEEKSGSNRQRSPAVEGELTTQNRNRVPWKCTERQRNSNRLLSIQFDESMLKDLVGKKISLYWPEDRKYYSCWILVHPYRKGIQEKNHTKLVYDTITNDVEVANISRRPWKYCLSHEIRDKPYLVGKAIRVTIDQLKNRNNYMGKSRVLFPDVPSYQAVVFVIDQWHEDTPEAEQVTLTKFVDVEFDLLCTENLEEIDYVVDNEVLVRSQTRRRTPRNRNNRKRK